jgi:flagellar biosynthesis/type III secretory pathway chaperone
MNVLTEMENLLRQEQELLLSGDFSRLEALVQRKTTLAEWLSKSKPHVDQDTYRQLAQQASHNEALLDAARRGMRAALSQLRMTSDPEGQSTYSEQGKRRPLSRAPSSITQKV